MLNVVYLFFRRHLVEIFRVLSNWKFARVMDEARIRCVKNKRILTKAQRKEIKNYFKPWACPSLRVIAYYVEKTGCFRPNYLSDGYYWTKIDMFFNNWSHSHVISNKILYYRLFPEIKQPDLICYRAGGLWFDSANKLESIFKFGCS